METGVLGEGMRVPVDVKVVQMGGKSKKVAEGHQKLKKGELGSKWDSESRKVCVFDAGSFVTLETFLSHLLLLLRFGLFLVSLSIGLFKLRVLKRRSHKTLKIVALLSKMCDFYGF